MAITKVISAVVAASAAALLDQTTPVGATCFCPAVYFLPSEYAEMGFVVLRADVLSRSDVNDDATYELDIVTLYAGESDVDYDDRIYFVTAASTDDCGVDLTIGVDHLLGLFRRTSTSDSDESAPFGLHACNLNKPWSSVSDVELADLATLLEDDDDDDDDDGGDDHDDDNDDDDDDDEDDDDDGDEDDDDDDDNDDDY